VIGQDAGFRLVRIIADLATAGNEEATEIRPMERVIDVAWARLVREAK
jgi:hypothetical protein